MLRTKEQGKNLQDQINEDKIGNLLEKEFRIMIVKMVQNLRNRMEKIQETFKKDLEELKSKQTVMNNTITEIKNTLEGINSTITEAEEWISELEDKMVEITAREQNKEKRMKRIEGSLRDLCVLRPQRGQGSSVRAAEVLGHPRPHSQDAVSAALNCSQP